MKKIVSSIIIIAIIFAIGGIWWLKNNEKETNETLLGNGAKEEMNEENSVNKTNENNPDFAFNITDNFDIEKLKSYKLPIIIDFGADYCMPCREMEPILEKLNEELKGKAIIRVIDVSENPELADGYPIEFIPTQMFINSDGTPYAPENADELELEYITDENGKHVLTIHIGMLTANELKSMLKEMGLNE